jgi:hypothetical protein
MTRKEVNKLFKAYENQAREELKGAYCSLPFKKALGKHICSLVNRDFEAGKFDCWADAKMLLDTAWMQYLR